VYISVFACVGMYVCVGGGGGGGEERLEKCGRVGGGVLKMVKIIIY